MPVDIDSLNPEQREAVLRTEGPLLVLAGAGSGKTRVLTYRIAHMIEDLGVAPWEILAITFTNKAAAEMRERLGQLVGPAARGMWVSTFHSMCVRILRANAEVLGFSSGFTIYDDGDSKRLVKEIMLEQDIDPKRFPVNGIRNRISAAKNELILPAQFEDEANDPIAKVAARVYKRLQERLKQANAFDFDDLLVYAYLLLKNHPQVLEAYQQRFRYLLVDEYQDTNRAQYAITNLLAAKNRNIMVVGDDDQSIYSWRGADIRNILDFEKDYPDCCTVKLERNYRSTGNILAAANAVIANNSQRKEKRLIANAGEGDKVKVYMAADERDEGRWIAGEIERRHAQGDSYNQVAVFYRTNAQSRMLEDMLLRAGVPYRIIGGTRFFDREEIRHVMAYLTLAVNPADDMAAKRVINVPKRGIGKTTIERIEGIAASQGCTFVEGCLLSMADEGIRMQTRRAIGEFVNLIDDAANWTGELRRVVEMIIDRSGYLTELENAGTDEARGRIENVREFLGVVDEYTETHDVDEAQFAAPVAGSAGRCGRLGRRSPGHRARSGCGRCPGCAGTRAQRQFACRLHRVGHAAYRPGFGCRRQRRGDAHDRACLEGPGIRYRLRCGYGRKHLPAYHFHERRCGRGRRTSSGLRCHHACAQAPVSDGGAFPQPVRPNQRQSRFALPDGNPPGTARHHGSGFLWLFRYRLGKARQPSRYFRFRRRSG